MKTTAKIAYILEKNDKEYWNDTKKNWDSFSNATLWEKADVDKAINELVCYGLDDEKNAKAIKVCVTMTQV